MDTHNPKEEIADATETSINTGNRVILFNDNIHTFEEVTNQVMLAIGCSEEDAFKIAYMVDRNGSAIVFEGDLHDCVRVSDILQDIGLHTQIMM